MDLHDADVVGASGGHHVGFELELASFEFREAHFGAWEGFVAFAEGFVIVEDPEVIGAVFFGVAVGFLQVVGVLDFELELGGGPAVGALGEGDEGCGDGEDYRENREAELKRIHKDLIPLDRYFRVA